MRREILLLAALLPACASTTVKGELDGVSPRFDDGFYHLTEGDGATVVSVVLVGGLDGDACEVLTSFQASYLALVQAQGSIADAQDLWEDTFPETFWRSGIDALLASTEGLKKQEVVGLDASLDAFTDTEQFRSFVSLFDGAPGPGWFNPAAGDVGDVSVFTQDGGALTLTLPAEGDTLRGTLEAEWVDVLTGADEGEVTLGFRVPWCEAFQDASGG